MSLYFLRILKSCVIIFHSFALKHFKMNDIIYEVGYFFESIFELVPPFGNYVNYAFMMIIFLFLVIWTYKMFVHKKKGQEHASE